MRKGFYKRSSLAYEHTRIIAYMYAAANRDPKKAFPTIQKWMPLPTDDNEIDEDEAENLRAVMKKFKEGTLYK